MPFAVGVLTKPLVFWALKTREHLWTESKETKDMHHSKQTIRTVAKGRPMESPFTLGCKMAPLARTHKEENPFVFHGVGLATPSQQKGARGAPLHLRLGYTGSQETSFPCSHGSFPRARNRSMKILLHYTHFLRVCSSACCKTWALNSRGFPWIRFFSAHCGSSESVLKKKSPPAKHCAKKEQRAEKGRKPQTQQTEAPSFQLENVHT